MNTLPRYRALLERGELAQRAHRACDILSSCTVCPRECRVNRRADERGYCRSGALPVVASYGPHFGEEQPLVGRNGSGTIFFTHCNLKCEFCQNYDISQCGVGREVTCQKLGEMMLRLQERGCHNINLVSPSHVVPQIIEALVIAATNGLSLPLVYNSGGFDSVTTLRLLDGIIDIYMPDAKYGREDIALSLSHAPHYPKVMQAALHEMQRQVGDLVIEHGIAIQGLIIRHLVLPHNLASSELVIRFIADEISHDAYVNIMDQYRWPRAILPEDIKKNPLLKLIQRPITREEFSYAIKCAQEAGLHRGFEEF